ncbi:MAG TPA: 3'-5' exonuclease, partial [Ilumatobacteraceae bacterium]|nr:3'-5' exonuclease [Ilumatobacteraceae bacterium]
RGVLDDSVSEQPDGPPITIKTCADEADEASLIARFVAQQIGSQRPGDIAVLARTNDQLNPIAEQLSAMGIAVERGARRSPLERALAEAYRCQNREVLAVWAETHSADANESLRRVAEAADRYLSSHEPGGFRIWVEVHQPFDDDLDAPALDAVTLASFHAAKGREWPTVVLAGLDAGLVPHASAVSDEQLAEEARLLYVAVTRAQSNLLVTRCEQRNGSLATESPWLAPIRRAGHIDRAVLPPDWIKQIHAAPNPLEPWLTWRAAVARAAGINVASVCSDATLRALHADPPGTIAEFAARIGITARAARAMRPPPIPLS